MRQHRWANAVRRHALKLFGLGAAGAVAMLAGVTAPDTVFAMQFVKDSNTIKTPRMVYDERLQMMVDPVSLLPIYEDAKNLKVASGLPIVTAGCSDCPKNDGTGS